MAAATPCFVNVDSLASSEFEVLEHGVYGHQCFNQDPIIIASCLTPGDIAPARGGTNPSRMLFLLGDSHAAAVVAGLSAALKGLMNVAWSATLFGGGFNAPWPNTACYHCNWVREAYTTSDTATYVSTAWEALQAHLRAGDVLAVVTSELRMPHADFISTQIEFLRAVNELVAARSAQLLLLADVPKLPQEGRLCRTPTTADDCVTPIQTATFYHLELHQATDAAYAAFAREKSDSVVYLDAAWMYARLCDISIGQCGPHVPGTATVAYYDAHHLSTAGSLYLAPFFHCFFELHVLFTGDA